MKIKDLLQRDPAAHPLVNQGQARIAAVDQLHGELSTFVCEGQYADGLQRILSSYLENLGRTSQRAAWVSGFFGSGKSHLLKMLGHLWVDTTFPDGATARSLVPALPEEIRSLLRELDTAGKRGGGLLAAAGSLPSGTTDRVRLTVLSVLLRAAGLPEQFPQARFCLWLRDQGWFDQVKVAVEASGKTWGSELNNLYVSARVAKALLACDPNLAATEADVHNVLLAQFPVPATDISTEEFLSTVKRALRYAGHDGRIPCTVFLLDEVQQYIGDSNDRSTLITEVTEALSKQLDGQVLVVASGQSALTATPKLQKLNDRYTLRVQLSDQDVEAVVRKVLLQKKPAAIQPIRDGLCVYAGEISRQLQGTRIAETAQDRDILPDDYPLLPVRRRFWEHCFRAVDAAGTHSQLRSQLRIVHDAVGRLADREFGTVVPGDELFEALAPEMVNTGVLLREINERIIQLSKDGSPGSHLARRVCGLVFLINKLPREATADIGVRASKEHVADLLIDDVRADNGKLREAVRATLESLASRGVLMKVGEEYRLQTKEGSEWDREFRNRQARLGNDEVDLQIRRDQLLYAEADRIVRSLRIVQGASKEPRQVAVSRDANPPQGGGAAVPLWIRDGWSATEKEVVDAARTATTSSPTIFMFIARQSADELRRLVIDAEAAQQTLDAKGQPAGAEGLEARRSMESRRDVAVQQRDELVGQVVANAKVFQGGGSELLRLTLEDRLREATTTALMRLFPRFKDADSAAWDAVIKRAREGADSPLQPVGHTGPLEQHPVFQQVLATIGSGMIGGEVRKALEAGPFGWPQDAIDAALMALHRSQHLSATLNGAAITPGQLDQNKITKAEIRVERVTLSVTDRLALRKLFQSLSVECKSREELAKAPVFLDRLLTLASTVGGNPPLPTTPATADIAEIRARAGNEQLAGIRDQIADIEKRIREWKKAKDLVDVRLPVWEILQRLVSHARQLPPAAEHVRQVDAVCEQRLLLAATDPVSPLRSALADVLRKALFDAHAALETALAAGLATLNASPPWQRLSSEARAALLIRVGLTRPAPADVSSDTAMLAGLDSRSLAMRQAEVDAVPGRVQRALEQAAQLLEPKARPVQIERVTLATPDDVQQWLDRQGKRLLDEIKNGPVLVS